jgi:hypothetical protein
MVGLHPIWITPSSMRGRYELVDLLSSFGRPRGTLHPAGTSFAAEFGYVFGRKFEFHRGISVARHVYSTHRSTLILVQNCRIGLS